MDKLLPLIAVAVMLLLAGCAEITMENTVSPDGDLEESSYELILEDEVYNFMLSDVRDDGYDDVEEWMVEESTDDIDEYGEITSDYEELDDGSHKITVTITEIPNSELNEIDITVSDDTIEYEHVNPFGLEDEAGEDSDEFGPGFEMNYIVHMPGDITDTNAHDVNEDRNTAEWNYLGDDDPEDVYVESEREQGMIESIPGFTGVAVILALFLSAVVAKLRPVK